MGEIPQRVRPTTPALATFAQARYVREGPADRDCGHGIFGGPMRTASCRWFARALLVFGFVAASAHAQVVVVVEGDLARASIELADDQGVVYSADATIQFDTPLNLAPQTLNLTASLVDPLDPALAARLPAGLVVDPAFPVLVTVEPPVVSWLFRSGFDGGPLPIESLSFRNAYRIEIHTHDLVYTPGSPYRLLKAPLGGAFADVTEDVLPGSTRARGRGGAFSEFIVAADSRAPLLVALDKLVALDARLLAAVLGDTLRLDLVALLAQVHVAVLVPIVGCGNALLPLDDFLGEIAAHAGVDIANLWRAERDLANDAGELESLAWTLRFSLLGCAGTP